MTEPSHAEIMHAIGALESEVKSLRRNIRRIDESRTKHFAGMYGRLEALEANANLAKGKMAIVGASVIFIGTAIAGAIGALVARFIGFGGS